jgi:L-lactate dehydrogenase complex protein LldE
VKVALFVTCLVDLVVPEVGVAAARVLQRAGHEVVFPEGQTCCGQPAFNSGYRDEAAKVLAGTAQALREAGADAIVAPAGSCTTMFRTFAPGLVGEVPHVYELSEFLSAHGGDLRGSLDARVAYHDSCHMLRELGLSAQPRALLEHMGAELVEWDAERCCGFGGTFAVRQPELSVAMADEKLRSLDGAQVLCGSDPSCLMHLRGRLRRLGSEVRVAHLAELLEEATR